MNRLVIVEDADGVFIVLRSPQSMPQKKESIDVKWMVAMF
jgi:hypothetical protein